MICLTLSQSSPQTRYQSDQQSFCSIQSFIQIRMFENAYSFGDMVEAIIIYNLQFKIQDITIISMIYAIKTGGNLLCFLMFINITLSFRLFQTIKQRTWALDKVKIDQQAIADQDVVFGNVNTYAEQKAKQYAYLSMITHCSDSQIQKWDCKLCKSIVLTDLTIIQNTTYNIAGFVGYSKSLNQIVVSWRGTVDIKNWELDFKYKKTKYIPRSGTCSGCEVHLGVYQGYRSVQGQINKTVSGLLSKFPTASITSTGHSLGGGLSLLTSLQLSLAYPQKVTFTYNYGCLRIGNSAFVSFLKTKITSIYRIVHNKDPVPHLPPYDFGYIHPANEILYDGPMKNFTICNDSGEDKNCSNKFVPFLEPNDHTFYFVPTDASVC